jgi:hypothetical protein
MVFRSREGDGSGYPFSRSCSAVATLFSNLLGKQGRFDSTVPLPIPFVMIDAIGTAAGGACLAAWPPDGTVLRGSIFLDA